MGRPSLVPVVVVIAALLAACGSDEPVSDEAIVEAVALEPNGDGAAYTVGGDPFCEVGSLLNDSEEVEAAAEGGELDLVITDSDGEVGIVAVPPFDPECARKSKRNLDEVE